MEITERKGRLERSRRLLNNADWSFIKEEIEKDIKISDERRDVLQSKGLIHEAQYEAGLKRGLELALSKPSTILRKSLSVLEKIEEMIL